MTIVLSVVIGLVLSSAFAAIVVYATELMPHRIGAVSGLFFGLAFGMAGLVADWSSIAMVYRICAFLPVLGLTALFLPDPPRASSPVAFDAVAE